LGKWCLRVWIRFIWLRTGTRGGSCEHGNELSVGRVKRTHAWSRVLLEKVVVAQSRYFPTFMQSESSSTVFTRARHWPLFWGRPMALVHILILTPYSFRTCLLTRQGVMLFTRSFHKGVFYNSTYAVQPTHYCAVTKDKATQRDRLAGFNTPIGK
jgi:hypothetical protein